MGLSVLQEQHDVIIQEIKDITQGDWKCLVVDETSRKILDNAVKEDDILNNNIATIERIENRREPNPEMDAIYLLTPEPHIVDCLLADFERRRYRRAFLVWTNLLDPTLRRRIDDFPGVRQLRASSKTLFVDFYPRESHLITFRDPWSFPMLYHPACNSLVPKHMQQLAQRIAGVCITMGEYPKVRYYRPRNAIHEASVLCSHLARFVQEELDGYAHWDPNFPPPSTRPQANLIITDRSMDLMAPLIHEFTYQAMAADLLPIKDGDKVTFHTTVHAGTPEEKEKDMELSDKDKIWVDNRHRHMKDTIDKLMGDFQKFLDQNPHFTNENADTTNLNTIRDMLAGLPQFQEMKEAYSLHLTMAQECMNIFQHNKLPDIASIEQTMSTGLDEDFRKPKNVCESVVRLLDDDAIMPSDRLRLVIIYVLYRGGVIMEDIQKLLIHASLPPQDAEVAANMELLGGKTSHVLKEPRQVPPPLFPRDPKAPQPSEEYSLSRFEPALKSMLDALSKGTLDQTVFPYVKPPMDPNEDLLVAQGGSLRAGRPNWAAAGRRPPENRQRIFVFMAGGATYSESRACYEIGNLRSRDIILATSHMLTPQLFIRQVSDLSRDKRQLDLPMDRPKPRAPAHLFERPAPPQDLAHPRVQAPALVDPAMGAMNLNAPPGSKHNKPAPGAAPDPSKHDDGKLHKEKKRRNFLGADEAGSRDDGDEIIASTDANASAGARARSGKRLPLSSSFSLRRLSGQFSPQRISRRDSKRVSSGGGSTVTQLVSPGISRAKDDGTRE
ncbi:Sec1 family superfamily [Purpureocillium lavendulum]|uniref:Sec1 family superfamily n=1 Tax=Purpureocillium lavendulum TaxID=1247861 RepID=A0AB34G375_9HYPO|nr:Sec1 family superfamily [Purpureocillium lavendulum]